MIRGRLRCNRITFDAQAAAPRGDIRVISITKLYPIKSTYNLFFTGVGELIRLAASRGRAARRDLELGVCGEHGGDPKSIEFFESLGMEYVSCSPLRVPVARLAAAQAAIKYQRALAPAGSSSHGELSSHPIS